MHPGESQHLAPCSHFSLVSSLLSKTNRSCAVFIIISPLLGSFIKTTRTLFCLSHQQCLVNLIAECLFELFPAFGKQQVYKAKGGLSQNKTKPKVVQVGDSSQKKAYKDFERQRMRYQTTRIQQLSREHSCEVLCDCYICLGCNYL